MGAAAGLTPAPDLSVVSHPFWPSSALGRSSHTPSLRLSWILLALYTARPLSANGHFGRRREKSAVESCFALVSGQKQLGSAQRRSLCQLLKIDPSEAGQRSSV